MYINAVTAGNVSINFNDARKNNDWIYVFNIEVHVKLLNCLQHLLHVDYDPM